MLICLWYSPLVLHLHCSKNWEKWFKLHLTELKSNTFERSDTLKKVCVACTTGDFLWANSKTLSITFNNVYLDPTKSSEDTFYWDLRVDSPPACPHHYSLFLVRSLGLRRYISCRVCGVQKACILLGIHKGDLERPITSLVALKHHNIPHYPHSSPH